MNTEPDFKLKPQPWEPVETRRGCLGRADDSCGQEAAAKGESSPTGISPPQGQLTSAVTELIAVLRIHYHCQWTQKSIFQEQAVNQEWIPS